jgi:hypothetical protein
MLLFTARGLLANEDFSVRTLRWDAGKNRHRLRELNRRESSGFKNAQSQQRIRRGNSSLGLFKIQESFSHQTVESKFMPDINQWFQPLLDVFNSISFQILILAGSGILAVSLLLLAMTHWGKSRPVWKCVILSFAAHILLMGYAYGTRMLGPDSVAAEQASMETDEVLNVSLLDDSGDEVVTSPNQIDSPQLKIATSTTPLQVSEAMPELEMDEVPALQRAALDTEVIFENVLAAQDVSTVDSAAQEFSANDFDAPLPPPRDDLIEPQEADFGFESDLAMLPEGKIIDPEPIDFDNLEAEEKGENDFEVETDLARVELSESPDPMKLIESSSSDFLAKDNFVPAVPARLPMPAGAPNLAALDQMKPIPKPKRTFQAAQRTKRLADGKAMPTIYSLRATKSRLAVARNRGGSIHTERAVEKALDWLAANQEADGSWSPSSHGAGREDRIFGHNRDGAGGNAETGISGLATLAFLGAGNTHLQGPHAQTIDKAIKYLTKRQKSNGDLSGDAKLFARMYCHSMALLALSEALAITGDSKLLAIVQKGVDFSVAAQNKNGGGWRYQPGDSGDMSQFGWQVMALKSARLGGAYVPEATFEQMEHFLASCSSGIGGGLASYRPRQRPSATMTAEALLCRYFLNVRPTEAGLIEAKRMVMRELPNRSHVNLYYWYYGTLAMYHAGGDEWQKWNAAMKEALLPMQQMNGQQAGSWAPVGMWGGYGGRVYSTATAALSLEVYYRYLPVYEEVARQGGRPIR